MLLGVKEHLSPLVTGTKKLLSRLDRSRCKMRLSLLLLPEGGVNWSQVHSKQRGPHPWAFRRFPPLHPLLIKVGSFHDNHSQRDWITNELDFCNVDISSLHCLFSSSVWTLPVSMITLQKHFHMCAPFTQRVAFLHHHLATNQINKGRRIKIKA